MESQIHITSKLANIICALIFHIHASMNIYTYAVNQPMHTEEIWLSYINIHLRVFSRFCDHHQGDLREYW